MHSGASTARTASAAARDALAWVTDASVPADGGQTYPATRAPGAPLTDDLYFGTAGVLVSLAQAHLAGLTEFDEHARAAASRLMRLEPAAAAGRRGVLDPALEPEADAPDLSLYTGYCGVASALHAWALASGDEQFRDSARAIADQIASVAAAVGQQLSWND